MVMSSCECQGSGLVGTWPLASSPQYPLSPTELVTKTRRAQEGSSKTYWLCPGPQATRPHPKPVRSCLCWAMAVGTVTGPEYPENAWSLVLLTLGTELQGKKKKHPVNAEGESIIM